MDITIIPIILLTVVAVRLWDLLRSATGVFQVDHSNPDKDIYRISLDDQLESLRKKKRVILKIDHNADLSQK